LCSAWPFVRAEAMVVSQTSRSLTGTDLMHRRFRSGSRVCALALALGLGTPHGFAQSAMQNRYIPAEKLPWYREAPSIPVQLAPLWGDRAKEEAGTLLQTPPGFASGPHSHTADYWAVVVRGAWKHWVPSTGEGVGLTLEPGAFWTQKHTQLHEDACVSKEPCIIFLFNKKPYVTEFPKSSAKKP
jgi:hypothetical protein